jgi:hypothetical protein
VDITDLEGEPDKPVRQELAIYYKRKAINHGQQSIPLRVKDSSCNTSHHLTEKEEFARSSQNTPSHSKLYNCLQIIT